MHGSGPTLPIETSGQAASPMPYKCPPTMLIGVQFWSSHGSTSPSTYSRRGCHAARPPRKVKGDQREGASRRHTATALGADDMTPDTTPECRLHPIRDCPMQQKDRLLYQRALSDPVKWTHTAVGVITEPFSCPGIRGRGPVQTALGSAALWRGTWRNSLQRGGQKMRCPVLRHVDAPTSNSTCNESCVEQLALRTSGLRAVRVRVPPAAAFEVDPLSVTGVDPAQALEAKGLPGHAAPRIPPNFSCLDAAAAVARGPRRLLARNRVAHAAIRRRRRTGPAGGWRLRRRPPRAPEAASAVTGGCSSCRRMPRCRRSTRRPPSAAESRPAATPAPPPPARRPAAAPPAQPSLRGRPGANSVAGPAPADPGSAPEATAIAPRPISCSATPPGAPGAAPHGIDGRGKWPRVDSLSGWTSGRHRGTAASGSSTIQRAPRPYRSSIQVSSSSALIGHRGYLGLPRRFERRNEWKGRPAQSDSFGAQSWRPASREA